MEIKNPAVAGTLESSDCQVRIDAAVYRSVNQKENLPWGGAIRE